MPSPAFGINDLVVFSGTWYDGHTYRILRIQYLDENNEFIEGPSDFWQYEMAGLITNSVEDYIEQAPGD